MDETAAMGSCHIASVASFAILRNKAQIEKDLEQIVLIWRYLEKSPSLTKFLGKLHKNDSCLWLAVFPFTLCETHG